MLRPSRRRPGAAPRPRPCRSPGSRSARRPATASPGCFSHSPSVASVIDSPSDGDLDFGCHLFASCLPAKAGVQFRRDRRRVDQLRPPCRPSSRSRSSRAADFLADVMAQRVGDQRALFELVALHQPGRGRRRRPRGRRSARAAPRSRRRPAPPRSTARRRTNSRCSSAPPAPRRPPRAFGIRASRSASGSPGKG